MFVSVSQQLVEGEVEMEILIVCVFVCVIIGLMVWFICLFVILCLFEMYFVFCCLCVNVCLFQVTVGENRSVQPTVLFVCSLLLVYLPGIPLV